MIRENVSLQQYNTFGIEAKTRFMAVVKSVDDVRSILKNESVNQLPRLILGGGSNILFTQDFDGLAILNQITGISVIEEDEDSVLVEVGAGEVWHSLVLHSVKNGWGGIENLSLIPGSVGAAPMQNIGAYGVEIKDVFEELTAMNLDTLESRTFSNLECEFGYRESVFKRILKGQFMIVSVQLRLKKNPTLNTSYGAIESELSNKGISDPTISDVSQAVINIRQSKLPDPKELGNAGSFFKNPVIEKSTFEKLQNKFPNVPNYQAPNGIKLAAGWLVEQCGWKGKKIGNCGSHGDQALVLVNYGGSNGSEIFDLSEQILQSVKDKFGIQLEREVNVV
ncbi:MAG: UDP-N-acetylmuramate dehydrogenase [Bacteroidia bacterium]|jgi:UDP-N-acetylmuramate dehydrogenase